MRRSPLAVLVLLLSGCGAGQPPAGPKHDPSGSKEAATPCPAERKQAQEAREMLLGSSDPALLEATARSVLAEAHCEASALRSQPVPAGTHDSILAGLRSLRSNMQDADNLYVEVLRYRTSSWHGQALLGQSELKSIFADSVASIVPPTDLDGPAKLEFQAELGQALAILRAESEELHAKGCAALADVNLQDPRCV